MEVTGQTESLITLSNLMSGCIGAILAGIVTLIATKLTIKHYSKQQSMAIKMRVAGELIANLVALRDCLGGFIKFDPELALGEIEKIMESIPEDQKEANRSGILQNLCMQVIPSQIQKMHMLHEGLQTFSNVNFVYLKEATYKSVQDVKLPDFNDYQINFEQTSSNLKRYIKTLVDKKILENKVVIENIDRITDSIKADLGGIISTEMKI